jgi:Fe-S cluster assembly protein SufD
LGGDTVRNNLNISQNGEGCETHLYGLYAPSGTMHIDNHTVIDHQYPNTESNELYKGILTDKSTGVFNGKVYVRKEAQKTNAYQQNSNILLSDDAVINTKPQLEIWADDVKCSHGCTTGQLDKEQIFYLRSRGISETDAKAMLLHAYALDILNHISIEPLRLLLDKKVMEVLKSNG